MQKELQVPTMKSIQSKTFSFGNNGVGSGFIARANMQADAKPAQYDFVPTFPHVCTCFSFSSFQ